MVKDNLRATFLRVFEIYFVYKGLYKTFILRQYEMVLKKLDLAFDEMEMLFMFSRIYSSRNKALKKSLVCLVEELGKFY